ncbi:hypothetical protein AB0B85_29660 [Micromonospora sp. NPDC049044]|uniref:hypothetical protein n=1 Tax=unclassified Micromonospora TaxID=2617518 RepID=UPI0033F00CCB
MDLHAQRVATVRSFGTVALVAGFMTSLITMASAYHGLEPHILATFLILIGLGLRIEAAIVDRRS